MSQRQVSYANDGGGGCSSKGGLYDFVIDVEKLTELKEQLSSAADKIEDEVAAIYAAIYNLGSGADGGSTDGPWIGESYNAFRSKCDESKPALESLSLIIRAYSDMIGNQVLSDAETLATSVSEALSIGE